MTTPQLTDEQREQLLRSVAAVSASVHELIQACVPIAQAAARQYAQITQALQAAGYLDENGKPIELRRCGADSQAPNATGNERCTLPTGHDGRHADGILTWPRAADDEPPKERCDCPSTQAGLELCEQCPEWTKAV